MMQAITITVLSLMHEEHMRTFLPPITWFVIPFVSL